MQSTLQSRANHRKAQSENQPRNGASNGASHGAKVPKEITTTWARVAFDDIARIVLDMEPAQCRARGLLATLSGSLAAATVCDNAAIGTKLVAGELVENVAVHWKALNAAWGKARENRDNAEAQKELESALHDMVAPMRAAAACVHSLALALRQQAMIDDTFHAEGVLEGYEELAVYWASVILEPVDRWARPADYFVKAVAA